ncbi:RNA polymerase I-specific transcription initiation factor RRN3-like [Iris pallida]|uniref:RNA polymerase I-specific transcription initiation factor RRN3-like n=1 Tax=Iris pallida TaxID=29817 RepID=A0AAX6EV93_IRIPA|nr:RNA polymerase I-specific transcription initiation factor RRN3-like [Iris pallida]
MVVELTNPSTNEYMASTPLLPEEEEEEGYLSDSEALSSVVQVLDGVAMAHNVVSQYDQDQYDYLVSILDPTRRGPEEEATLVTAVKALTGAVSKINIAYHGSLLTNIFSMNIWNYDFEARKAVLELITSMAAVPDKFLDNCLHMLVSNFMPPRRMRVASNHMRTAEKDKIHSELHMALHYIANMVPLAPMKLRHILDRRMPKSGEPKEILVTFVECILGLESDEIGDYLGNTVLAKVVELLLDLDVNIHWEDILQEEHNKGIFDMELEDVEENANDVAGLIRKSSDGLKGNVVAAKLDSLMVIVCEHLRTCAYDGQLVKVFEMLTESFTKTLMNAHKSKFAQFVMFYACSLDPENCGQEFAYRLTDIFVSMENQMSSMSAVAYLASYLARAKFVSSSLVMSIVQRLVDWCAEYCQHRNVWDKTLNLKAHRVFYSGCQAVMYILCFRMRSLIDVPNLKSQLVHLPLELVLRHPLDPLKVCLPTIVQEFVRQALAAHLFKASIAFLSDNLLESEFSKTFGGVERLDTFFPFDPYLLKESDRFIRPNFMLWSMVKKTYSNCGSDDEDEDLDAPEFADHIEPMDGHEDVDLDSEDEDLKYSMNKMSITPKPAFHHPVAGNFRGHSQMPARIRPSVSPEGW